MAKRMPPVSPAATPKYEIKDCTFTINDVHGDALLELAQAARATAEAIASLAGRMGVNNEFCAIKIVGAEGVAIATSTVNTRTNGSKHS